MNAFFYIGLIVGVLVGVILVYFYFKTNWVSQTNYNHLMLRLQKQMSDFEYLQKQLSEVEIKYTTEQKKCLKLNDDFTNINQLHQHLTSKKESLEIQIERADRELKELKNNLLAENDKYRLLFAENSHLKAHNQALNEKWASQKNEIESLQASAKNEFQNLAQQILEINSKKFTLQNQDNLLKILEPFNHNIHELKKTVNETYDKESKERFSLAAELKNMKELNQRISDEAQSLTRALKGETKTQGRWGEMILESILEKSGLIKNQQFFMEHELKNDDNVAIRSFFEGKKMRPDAVIKYPDNRNVIIDSKVSLNSFLRMLDENNPEQKLEEGRKHVVAIKNHINALSLKAYDDFDKSLDFVLMFIPSEPAYIAAMQIDSELWNYAYDKRIVLISPTNLITSLKLISNLWKRESQNQNAKDIAERGGKLYDKFVGFVESLNKVKTHLNTANTSFDEAYKQLFTGNDNIVRQTQKLIDLGVKTKKELSPHMIEASQNNLINFDENETNPEHK